MNTKGLNIIHVNTRSIFKKIPYIETLYSGQDIIWCTETWLDDRILDNLIKMTDMSVFRCDRKKRHNRL